MAEPVRDPEPRFADVWFRVRGPPPAAATAVAAPAAWVEYPVELEVPGWARLWPGTLRLDRPALDVLIQLPERYGRALGDAVFAEPSLREGWRETLAALRDLRVRL